MSGQDFPTVLDSLKTLTSDLQRAHLAEVNLYKKEIETLKEILTTKEQDWLQEKRRLLEDNERINKLYERARDLVEKSNRRKRHHEESSVRSQPPAKKHRGDTSPLSRSYEEVFSNDDDDELNETIAPTTKSLENDVMSLEKKPTQKELKGSSTRETDLFDEIDSDSIPMITANDRTPPLINKKRASNANGATPPKLIDLVGDAENQESPNLPRSIITPSTKSKRLPLSKSPSNLGKSAQHVDDAIIALADAANSPPPTPHDPTPSKTPQFKYQEDRVYGKAERAKLPAYECSECAKFYDALYDGNKDNPERHRRIQHCGRHRTLFAAPSTPPGFWDIDFDSEDSKSKGNDQSPSHASNLDDSFF